ncbi:MAG: hypothetical protein OXG78_07080 [Chloroflexi bacterium]|nr:hypothetical protein [Chloroflexota bacterium]
MSESIDWQVETLRITAFPVEIDSVSPSELWDKHKGELKPEVHIQPDSINRRNARHRNGEIYLVKTPSQIDWRYVLPLDDTSPESGLPVWGNLNNELNPFLEFSKEFLQNPVIFPVFRLAFGAILMKPRSDLISSNEYLADFLPHLDLEDATDFGYQISRGRTSDVVNELHINRLSRWQVLTLERKGSTLDPADDGNLDLVETLFAARLELDINSSPDYGPPLNSDLLSSAFEELVDMGLEIARRGDVK